MEGRLREQLSESERRLNEARREHTKAGESGWDAHGASKKEEVLRLLSKLYFESFFCLKCASHEVIKEDEFSSGKHTCIASAQIKQ